jgi:hypothetical protein
LNLCSDVEYKNLVLLALLTVLAVVPVDPASKNEIKTVLLTARREISNSQISDIIDDVLSLTA